MATQPKPVKRDPRCANGRVYIHGGYTEVGKKADGTEYQKPVHTSSSKTLECRPEDAICVDDYKSACTKDRTVIYSQPFCMSTKTLADIKAYLKEHWVRVSLPQDSKK